MIQRKYLILLVLLTLSNYQLLFSQISTEDAITIDSCIKIALVNNYELKVYEQDEEIALKQYSIQKGRKLPSISISSEYMLTDQYDDLETYNSANASIQVYQPIWQNAKIKTAVKQAKKNSEAATIEFSINRSNIIYYTSANYITLLRNYKINQLTNKMVEQFAVTVDAAKERYKLGVSKRSDVLKSETEYSNIQLTAIQVETLKKIAEQNLLKAIGYPLNSSINIVDFLLETYSVLEDYSIDSLLNIAENNLPELKLINKQIEIQELSVSLVKQDQYPEIGAFTNYNWVDNPMYSNEYYGSVGLSFKLNIFNGFQKRNTIAYEKVRLQQLNFQEDEILQSVISEIRIAQLNLMESRERITNAQSQVKSSQETLNVTTEEYKQGISSMLELIDAQYVDFRANRNFINAQAEYHLATIALKRKTGLLTTQYYN